MPIIKRSHIEKKYDNTPVQEQLNVLMQELPYTQLVVEAPKPSIEATIPEINSLVDFDDNVKEEEIEEEFIKSMSKIPIKSTAATTIEKKPQSTKLLQLQHIVLFKESKLSRLIK